MMMMMFACCCNAVVFCCLPFPLCSDLARYHDNPVPNVTPTAQEPRGALPPDFRVRDRCISSRSGIFFISILLMFSFFLFTISAHTFVRRFVRLIYRSVS
jgi:hypothetical protein